jgi:hypothetical protein
MIHLYCCVRYEHINWLKFSKIYNTQFTGFVKIFSYQEVIGSQGEKINLANSFVTVMSFSSGGIVITLNAPATYTYFIITIFLALLNLPAVRR